MPLPFPPITTRLRSGFDLTEYMMFMRFMTLACDLSFGSIWSMKYFMYILGMPLAAFVCASSSTSIDNFGQ